MSNIEENLPFSEELIEQYIASHLKITTRAVKQMKKDNIDRYQRESMGALCKEAGLNIATMLTCYNTNPSVLSLLENTSKLEIVDNLTNLVNKKSDEIDVEYFNIVRRFLSRMFSFYTGKDFAYLDFNFSLKEEYDEKGNLTIGELEPFLQVELKNIYSAITPIKKLNLALYCKISNKKIPMNELFKTIELSFPEVSRKEQQYYSNKITLEIKIAEHFVGRTSGIVKDSSLHDKIGYYFEYLDVHFNDITLRLEGYKDGSVAVDYRFKGFGLDLEVDDTNNVFSYLNLWKTIGDRLCPKNLIYLKLVEKINEAIKDNKEEAFQLIFNLKSVVIDSIAQGLNGSFENVKSKYFSPYVEPFSGYLSKKYFEENWIKKEENIYTLEAIGKGYLYSYDGNIIENQ